METSPAVSSSNRFPYILSDGPVTLTAPTGSPLTATIGEAAHCQFSLNSPRLNAMFLSLIDWSSERRQVGHGPIGLPVKPVAGDYSSARSRDRNIKIALLAAVWNRMLLPSGTGLSRAPIRWRQTA